MKLPKELLNGIIIFVGIAIYFWTMELLGLADILFLRVFNAVIVFYGVTRTIRSNVKEGKNLYITNLISAGATAITGILLSVGAFLFYIYLRGGNSYVSKLPEIFVIGGKSSPNEYCFGLLFEGVASAVIVVLLAMQLWSDKTTTGD